MLKSEAVIAKPKLELEHNTNIHFIPQFKIQSHLQSWQCQFIRNHNTDQKQSKTYDTTFAIMPVSHTNY